MNAIEINGRPGDGWDVDWVISFERYPELAHLFPAEERKHRLALVEDMAAESHSNLLDVFVWSHELHLPEGFAELYPQVSRHQLSGLPLERVSEESLSATNISSSLTACPFGGWRSALRQ